MRKFFHTSTLAALITGLVAVLAGTLFVTSGHVGVGILFCIGAVTVLTKLMILSSAKNKTCRNCLHRVDANALLCPHCNGVIV